MCGFITAINFKDNKKIKSYLKSLKRINKHRGPDNIKFLDDDYSPVLFRRLSIIDISNNANQPFKSDDKKKHLVFNGAIYNFIELKKILIKKNYKFFTSSDTEVLMKCYEEWGIECVKKLRGMFSIILFDKSLNKIFFIRDRLGQKPLYYTLINKSLIASSEIKDILFIVKKLKKNISENKFVVDKYLLRGWADDSTNTFFKNIFQFPAGTYSTFKNGKLEKPIKYWELNLNKKNNFNKRSFNKMFNENIRIHLRCDTPLAATLSGGLDSGSIVRTAIKYKKDISTFSCVNSFADESKIINDLLKKFKIKHQNINTEKLYQKNTLRNLIKYQDEPLISASHFDQFILRKEIKSKGFKVILVGEGGDEVLGGYFRLVLSYLIEIDFKNQLNKNKIYSNIEKYFNIDKKKLDNEILKHKNKKNDIECFSPFFFTKGVKKLNPNLKFKNPLKGSEKNFFKKNLQLQLLKRDLPHILRAEDRISMANSLESRSPFIDHKLIEYILGHKKKYFVKDGIPKYMLRKAMTGRLPQSYIDNKKVKRPGSNSVILRFYSKQFVTLLEKNNIRNFDKNKILNTFKLEHKKESFDKISTFYFRVLNYLLWKNINFQ